MRPFYVFDRWGEMFDTISRPLEAIHTDTVNGEDSLTITALDVDIQKGDRIVWRDKFGAWHEHQVADTTQVHSDEGTYITAYCENSIAELLTDYLVEVEPKGATSAQALGRALEGSTWKVGPCDTTGTSNFSWYHVSAYDAISNIVETFGGELATAIELHKTVVSERTVAVVNRVGGDNGQLFTYGRHLQSVERTVSSDDVITALYGYGKGIQKTDEDGNATGGYSRKLTFGEVNGGQDWVGDDEARLRWGYPDGHGGIKHTFGQVEFSDCEDPDELLRLTKEALGKVSEPKVTYTVTLINLGQTGVTNGEDLQKGDFINIRDTDLDLRLNGRVLQVKRDLLDESGTQFTLGNLSETLTGSLKDRLANLDWLQEHMGSIEGMEDLGPAYLQAVIDRLNEEINMTGGYVYWEQGEGITTYDKPIDQNPTMVIQIKGGSFRIANKKKSDGSWDWRTFGTGDGFVADELITGTIKGGSNWWNLGTGDLVFAQGQISSADGDNFWNLTTGELQLAHGIIHDAAGNNSWNLDTGELKISSGTQVGNLSLSDYVGGQIEDATSGILDSANQNTQDAIEQLERDRLTQQAIFDTLTNGGSEQGIYLQGGRVYINATYIGAGILSAGKIQDRAGNNYWDLETGEFRLSMAAKVDTGSGSEQSLSSYVSSQATTAANSAVGSAMNDYVSKEGFDQLLTQQKVFNALTNNGSLKGLFMSAGELFINADFIKTGIIQGADGNSYWNLNTGDLESTGTMTSVGQSHTMHARLTAGKFDLVMDVTAIGRLYTSTYTTDPNVHPFTISCFTNLCFQAPGDIAVGYNSTQDSTVYSYATAKEVSTNILTDITQAGTTLMVKYRNGYIRHGMLCGYGSEGTWNVYL